MNETVTKSATRFVNEAVHEAGTEVVIEAGKNYLLFDGDCGICTRSAEVVRRLDRGSQFIVEPYQAIDERELARFGLSYETCSKALQVITQRGRVHSGAFGVNYFLWRQFPWSLLVIVIYALPILVLAEVIIYKLIAHNRHRISAWLGMTACAVRKTEEP